MELAITPSVAKNMAWRSRGITCVETGSTASPIFSRHAARPPGRSWRRCRPPGDGAGGDLPPRRDQPLAVAPPLGVVTGELQSEGGRLGVHAVAAADARRQLVLEGAALQGGEERIDVGEKDVGGAAELYGEAGIQHVGGRHALVHEACLGPMLGEVGQEGDDVVLRLALDLVDARARPRSSPLPDGPRRLAWESRQGPPGRRKHAPRSRARCGSPASRWPPFRFGCSVGSAPSPYLVVVRRSARIPGDGLVFVDTVWSGRQARNGDAGHRL